MTRPTLRPKRLRHGGTIGVIAPSSHIGDDRTAPGIAFLESSGFTVTVHPQTAARHGQFAGTEAERVAALHAMVRDPGIDAIMVTAGGNGATHLLPLIDYDLIAAHPKPIMGFSDVTALLNAMTARTGMVTFHGPTLSRIGAIDALHREQMIHILRGESVALPACGTIMRAGTGEGRLIGGNLSVLQALIGTPYAPDMTDAILFIEDTGDHVSRYDRMIGHMKNAGWFDKLGGLIIGEFSNTQDSATRPFGFTLDERVTELAQGYRFPIVHGAPIGHGTQLCTMPVGCRARLEGTRLTLLESPVA